ncbi:TetR/AcrR family transcriptional regulator [Umezawaea sp. Da 62-37]|uniref:TetR/AcrR family transcriptional regulator n=1 Tax=Umezawaea sp. Da 62-37 TaxID=3075927 RepID=UPI0028F70773|nr:TetR/AcrR family transcriptional regulator [Umezawaea sp. Da 62-37]WNV83532.1 TetR/AcrR family transcriptional regulator [Umezawaea sp. Da 62-37]
MSTESPHRFDVVWTRRGQENHRQRPSLSIDRIVGVALRIADQEGVGALSMRRIATELGSGTTSLYRHVAGKDDLIDLMVDAVYGEVELPTSPSGQWRIDLRFVAHTSRTMMRKHPWLAAEAASRPAIGPNALRHLDFALTAAGGASADITRASGLLGVVGNYVLGAVVNELAEQESRRRTGLTEEEWRAAVSPYIEEVVASGHYPEVNRRIRDAEDLDHDEQFEFGLDCLLDGIAARAGVAG